MKLSPGWFHNTGFFSVRNVLSVFITPRPVSGTNSICEIREFASEIPFVFGLQINGSRNMSLLRSLKIFFGWFLQRCRAYGAWEANLNGADCFGKAAREGREAGEALNRSRQVAVSCSWLQFYFCKNFLSNFLCSEGALEISQLRSGWKIRQQKFVPQGTMENVRLIPPCLPARNQFVRFNQPLRSWLISGVASRQGFDANFAN
jgi:hypothetical protein